MPEPHSALLEALLHEPIGHRGKCGKVLIRLSLLIGLGIAILVRWASCLRRCQEGLQDPTQNLQVRRLYSDPGLARTSTNPQVNISEVKAIFERFLKDDDEIWNSSSPNDASGFVEDDNATQTPMEGLDVDFVVDQIYESVYGRIDPPEELEMMMTSEAKGSRNSALFLLRTTDGAYAKSDVEIFPQEHAPRIYSKMGYDGADKVWTWDDGHQRVEMDLDQKETQVLVFWSLFTLYVLPWMRDRLDFEVLEAEEAAQMGADTRSEVCLAMKLKKSESFGVQGIVSAYQFVDTKTWLPTRLRTRQSRRFRTQEILRWRNSETVQTMIFPNEFFVVEMDHRETWTRVWSARPLPSASANSKSLNSASANWKTAHWWTPRNSEIQWKLMGLALADVAPLDIQVDIPDASTWDPDAKNPYRGPSGSHGNAIFDTTVNKEVDGKLYQDSHMSLPVSVNGRDAGYWMLDTGASNNVMSLATAKRLGLRTFGEHEIISLGGNATATYVKEQNITVGPMTVNSPSIVVLDLEFLDKGGISGLLGYDFFSRVVFEIYNDLSNSRALIHDPQDRMDLEAQPVETLSSIRFTSRVPFVEATVQGECGSPPSTNLMLLDLGAFADVTFSQEGARIAGVVTDCDANDTSAKKEIAHGCGGRFEVNKAKLKYVDFGGLRILPTCNSEVSVIKDFDDLSEISNGMIGLPLFRGYRLVLDYQRKQLGVAKLKK